MDNIGIVRPPRWLRFANLRIFFGFDFAIAIPFIQEARTIIYLDRVLVLALVFPLAGIFLQHDSPLLSHHFHFVFSLVLVLDLGFVILDLLLQDVFRVDHLLLDSRQPGYHRSPCQEDRYKDEGERIHRPDCGPVSAQVLLLVKLDSQITAVVWDPDETFGWSRTANSVGSIGRNIGIIRNMRNIMIVLCGSTWVRSKGRWNNYSRVS